MTFFTLLVQVPTKPQKKYPHSFCRIFWAPRLLEKFISTGKKQLVPQKFPHPRFREMAQLNKADVHDEVSRHDSEEPSLNIKKLVGKMLCTNATALELLKG